MSNRALFHDSLYRLRQIGTTTGVQLVRIVEPVEGNRYAAVPVEFDSDGGTTPAGEDSLTVTNLAEPADAPGTLPAETEAVAIDVEGRWVIFVRQAGSPMFCARVLASQGNAAYTVREQVRTDLRTFADKIGAADLTACNLAELSLGPGAAVDAGTLVLVTTLSDDANPPSARYVFSHPAYAKYLD